MPQPPTAGLSKATGGLRGCAHPRGELCTEAEHEPVDSLVHEILVASSEGADCSLITNRTETRSRGEISGFSPKQSQVRMDESI
jgi:hypothetical protein